MMAGLTRRRAMRQIPLLAIVGVILLGSFMQPASGEVIVYVGYLNNLDGQPAPSVTPTPFDSDATTTLLSSGGITTLHDTGVIRFENRTASPVTIDRGLRVITEQRVFQIWGGFLPVVLAPGKSLVLAETENFNF